MNSGYVDRQPAKWIKHKVLVHCGLREESDLLGNIHRYNILNHDECLNDIENDILYQTDTYAYIVKLVYSHSYYRLPNILITNKCDCDNARKILAIKPLTSFAEIWYCKNLICQSGTIFGRLVFSNNDLYPRNCSLEYEMIWAKSARCIENYPNVDSSYIRLSRDNWNADVRIDECISCGLDVGVIEKKALHIIERMSFYSQTISDFGALVFSCGCSHLSVEFSYIDNVLKFIDWDSDNDEHIIHLFSSIEGS